MNHVKCIFNSNVPRRVSSNTGITKRSSSRSERGASKSPVPTADNSFVLAVKKVYPFLVQHHRNSTRLSDRRRDMLCGAQSGRSKSIACSLRRLLSERKLPLQYIDGINGKQAVRFGSSSSSLSYDRTINYDDDDDRESRSYAQMITAYNETMTTLDNGISQDRSNSKMNVQLSKTLFRTTSTLSSSAYNFENFTIKENMQETSMTDLSYAIDTTIDNENDVCEDSVRTKDFEVPNPSLPSKNNTRSYANIIADYSATMDINTILNKYRKDLSPISTESTSTLKIAPLAKSPMERNVSENISSPDLGSTVPHRIVNTKEELDWLKRVDKILNDLKKATGKVNTKVTKNVSALKEDNILKCVTEQAVWVDKSTLTNRRNISVVKPTKVDSPKYQEAETKTEVRAEKSDNESGKSVRASPNNPTSSSYDASSRKDWTQIPRSTATGNATDPQVELRMVPSGNESIVSVNVEAIAKAMEPRNPDSKELSVVVSSNNKEVTRAQREALAYPESPREGHLNYGSMRISISEGSLPVKELELSINGKPISDIRSIKARTETLDVMTSMDKVEIRVPYSQNNLGNVNKNTKNFAARNVQSAESVLKLRIATAFDGTYPVITTGIKKNIPTQTNVPSGSPKARYTHTEGSNVAPKAMTEVPPVSVQEPPRKIEKIPEPSPKITTTTKIQAPPEPSPKITTTTKVQAPPEPSPKITTTTKIQAPPEPSPKVATNTKQQAPPEPSPKITTTTKVQAPPEPSPKITTTTKIQAPPEPSPKVATNTKQQASPEPSPKSTTITRIQAPPEPSPKVATNTKQQAPPEPSPKSTTTTKIQAPPEPSPKITTTTRVQAPPEPSPKVATTTKIQAPPEPSPKVATTTRIQAPPEPSPKSTTITRIQAPPEPSPKVASNTTQQTPPEPSPKVASNTTQQTPPEPSPNVASNTKQGKPDQAKWTKIRNKILGGLNTATSFGGGDVKVTPRPGDIDLRLTKTFGNTSQVWSTDPPTKVDTKGTAEVKKEGAQNLTAVPGNNVTKVESPRDPKVKTASDKDGVKTLADIIAKKSGRSSDGNSSGVAGNPKGGPNQKGDGTKPPAAGANKREAKTADEAKNKSALNEEPLKSDTFDERISLKWSPWWSTSDPYVKLKREEDYQRVYSPRTNVVEQQMAKKSDSPSKGPPDSPNPSSAGKTASSKSQDPSKSKRPAAGEEKKQEAKDSNASSKVRDAEKTLKSSGPSKSENVPITRHDSPRVSEKSTRPSSLSPAKIAEKKLSKPNEEGSVLKETKNVASTPKKVESTKSIDRGKDSVKVATKETPKISDLRSKGVDSKTQDKIVDLKPKDMEGTNTEKLVRQQASSSSAVIKTKVDIPPEVKKKDLTSHVTKRAKSTSDINDMAKMKEILNSMKPIEKKKDGTLIDYGVKVPSRKKPEMLKGRSISNVETGGAIKAKQKGKESGPTTSTTDGNKKEDGRLSGPGDDRASQIIREIKKGDLKEDKAKKEAASMKEKNFDKKQSPPSLSEPKKEAAPKPLTSEEAAARNELLKERIVKVLEKRRSNVAKTKESPKEASASPKEEPPNVKSAKSAEDPKKTSSETLIPEKVAESLNEQVLKAMQRSKDRNISYQNIIKKEVAKSRFTNKAAPVAPAKEESENIKKAKTNRGSDEDIREPFEGTVTPKPSKSSPTGNTGATEPFAGTIVRRPSKDSEKRKPKNVSYKQVSKPNQLPVNAAESPRAHPQPINLIDTKTKKNKDDSSGSKNDSGTPSNPVNPSGTSSSKPTKSNASRTIDLIKSDQSDKLLCKERVKQQINVKPNDSPTRTEESEKDLVYSVWLQRSKEKTDDKKP